MDVRDAFRAAYDPTPEGMDVTIGILAGRLGGDPRALGFDDADFADLSTGRRDALSVTWDEQSRWIVMHRGDVAICCNLSPERQVLAVPGIPTGVLLASTDGWSFGNGRVETDGESVVVLELVP